MLLVRWGHPIYFCKKSHSIIASARHASTRRIRNHTSSQPRGRQCTTTRTDKITHRPRFVVRRYRLYSQLFFSHGHLDSVIDVHSGLTVYLRSVNVCRTQRDDTLPLCSTVRVNVTLLLVRILGYCVLYFSTSVMVICRHYQAHAKQSRNGRINSSTIRYRGFLHYLLQRLGIILIFAGGGLGSHHGMVKS